MAVGADELGTRFGEHELDPDRAAKTRRIRSACMDLALVIDETAPDSREKSDSLTNLDYVMYQANAAIARRGR